MPTALFLTNTPPGRCQAGKSERQTSPAPPCFRLSPPRFWQRLHEVGDGVGEGKGEGVGFSSDIIIVLTLVSSLKAE